MSSTNPAPGTRCLTFPNPAGIIFPRPFPNCFAVPLYPKSLDWGDVPKALKLAMKLRQCEGGRLPDMAFAIPLKDFEKIVGKDLLNDDPYLTYEEQLVGSNLMGVVNAPVPN